MTATCGGLVYAERSMTFAGNWAEVSNMPAAARVAAGEWASQHDGQLPDAVEVCRGAGHRPRLFTVMGRCEGCNRVLLQEEPLTDGGELEFDVYAADEDGMRVCLACIQKEAA